MFSDFQYKGRACHICFTLVEFYVFPWPVPDLSRTNLWLAWNTINRAELPPGSITDEDYEAGRSGFSELLSSGSNDSLLDVADGECALGRN